MKFTHDDKSHEFDADNVTIHDALKSLSLDKKAIAAKLNGEILDLSRNVTEGGEISPITPDSPEGLEILRHSTAHLMAQAVLRLYPGSHFGVGPAIKDGFYYDIDATATITEEDLPKIEAEMRRIAGKGEPVTRENMSKSDALKFFADDPYKT